VTQTEIQVAWPHPQPAGAGVHTAYKIRYKKDSELWNTAYSYNIPDVTNISTEHLSADGSQIRYTIDKLDQGTSYNFEITAVCHADQAKANKPIKGTTLEPDNECGAGECDRSSTIPIASLSVGDVIDVADYTMTIEELTPEGGDRYSGKGLAELPM